MTSFSTSLLNQFTSGIFSTLNLDSDSTFPGVIDNYSHLPVLPGLDIPFDKYIGKNVLYIENSLSFLFNLIDQNVFFIVDKNAHDMLTTFSGNSFKSDKLILSDNLTSKSAIDSLITSIRNSPFFVAFGTGFLQDICKFVQHVTQIPCLLIPTALSTHVFASNFIHAHSVLHDFGLTTSLKSSSPFISVLCADLLAVAHHRYPRLLHSGIADVYALRTATIEWQFGSQYQSSSDHKIAVILSNKTIELLLSSYQNSNTLDFVLSQVLLNVITDVVGSPPASGTEHLYANIIEKYHSYTDLHGELVAKGITLQTSILDIFPKQAIFSEMMTLNIFPNSPLVFDNIDDIILSQMLELSQLKKRFTILSLANT
jgi:glycerol-1-phosphate dehydrogenase [NAD(P)+]